VSIPSKRVLESTSVSQIVNSRDESTLVGCIGQPSWTIRSHGMKLIMLGRKLHSGTFETFIVLEVPLCNLLPSGN